MLKPPMPTAAGMTDTLDFVKNLWGGMNVPGAMGGAALSTDELDKKIADLKAVESWLNLNANMLRATIQAMEVQRGTIATLKSMSESMAQAMGQTGEGGPGGTTPFPFFAQHGAGAAQAGAQQQNARQPEGAQQRAGAQQPSDAQPAGSAQQPTGAQTAAASPEAPATGAPAAGAGPEAPAAGAAMPAALAWWNMLQEQFTQAVASTMSPEAMAQATAMAQDAAARFGAAGAAAATGHDAPPEGAEPGPKAAARKPKADKA